MIWALHNGGKMSLFKYSKKESKINKVLKMNKDNSSELLNDKEMDSLRSEADKNISLSKKLLDSLGTGKELQKMSSDIFKKNSTERIFCISCINTHTSKRWP